MTKHLPSATKSDVLKESCKFAHARWAAWLAPVAGAWNVQLHAGLTRARLEWLQNYLQDKNTVIWLAGALGSRRRRFRSTGTSVTLAGCANLFVYPGGSKNHLLMVGTDENDEAREAFWRILSMISSDQPNQILNEQISLSPPDSPDESSPSSMSQVERTPRVESQWRNARQLISLVEMVNSLPEKIDPGMLAEVIQATLQQQIKTIRGLLEARYIQLTWTGKIQSGVRLPYALNRGNSNINNFVINDYDPEISESFQAMLARTGLSTINTYIRSLGEVFLLSNAENLEEIPENPPISTRALKRSKGNSYSGNYSLLGSPLRAGDQVSGTIVVLDDHPERAFTQKDQSLLEQFIPQIEVIIGYARLSLHLQERLTAQHLVEGQLIRSARLAAVGEMAAGVAHELNNPLTTVTGFVELVKNELPADSSMREDLDLALKEALRARGIVRSLLDFSRPSQDQRIPTDLNDLISQVLNLNRHMLRMNNLSIRLELWEDLPLVEVDPNKIQQVLHNLVQNAIKAMPSGGTLTVQTSTAQRSAPGAVEKHGKWAVIRIQDSGVGIPGESLGRLFEPFFTHQTKERQDEPGIGLGLSISYGIIQNHQGFIEVESTVNQGSTFTVYLPCGEDKE